jgi:GH25 family lysozyme M1 (1,4-beta-N-acetylmuramidase)
MSLRGRALTTLAFAAAMLAVASPQSSGQNPNNPKGIDVSYYQGSVNWTSVKNSGITFTIIRAGHGDTSGTGLTSTGVDVNFATNWAGAKAAGVIRGAYWLPVPSASPSLVGHATALATKFVNTVQPQKGDIQLTIDFEVNTNSLTPANMQTWMQACVSQIKTMTNRNPMIYCSQSFWNSNMPTTATNMGCPLWVANWFVTSPKLPNAWTTYAFWQYNDNGTCPGISGAVDSDTCNGSLSFLQSYTYPRDPMAPRR